MVLGIEKKGMRILKKWIGDVERMNGRVIIGMRKIVEKKKDKMELIDWRRIGILWIGNGKVGNWRLKRKIKRRWIENWKNIEIIKEIEKIKRKGYEKKKKEERKIGRIERIECERKKSMGEGIRIKDSIEKREDGRRLMRILIIFEERGKKSKREKKEREKGRKENGVNMDFNWEKDN